VSRTLKCILEIVHIVHSEHHRLHATAGLRPDAHPSLTAEVPARIEVIIGALRSAGSGPMTSPSDHGLDPILAVHEPEFVHFLRTLYENYTSSLEKTVAVYADTFAVRPARRKPRGLLGLLGQYTFSTDCPVVEGTWTAAYWSAQCALTAANLVRSGERTAYALCRPPGHHAAADLFGGFCYLNNAAIAARHLQAGSPASTRVAILDVDYHHGNGTQSIFYADPSVLYCSLHADPDEEYPYYWGAADERGEGAGEGFNLNWPLPPLTDDAQYLAALDEAVAAVRAFGPEYLVVSAGFDMVEGDPAAIVGFGVTAAGVSEIGRRIAKLGLPTVVVQEGGYSLERLGEDVVAFLRPFA
jgi:acetoin utilization deacetylase AcuC-like enzyme